MIALDTSVIVAGMLEWHESHAAALAVLNAALSSRAGAIVPAPALIEAYAVMTRLPAPHRLSGVDAGTLLAATFRTQARLSILGEKELWDELDRWPAAGAVGGRSYDAHIIACAIKAGAKKIVTLNVRDFQALAGERLEVAAP